MKNNDYKRILFALTVILMLLSIAAIFFYAPIPINPGERGTATGPDGEVYFISSDEEWINYKFSFHIAYFHIPIALTAYVAFLFVLIFSILYLRDGLQKWDIKAASSAEIGVIFAGLTLITGSIWAKAAWGHYWPPGDVRLNTSLVLFLIYLAYLMIRQGIDEPEKRARLSAVFGIIGFLSVPISFLSIRLWAASTTHPTVIGPGGGGISGSAIIFPILLNLAAFILLCISLIIYKVDNSELQEDLIAAKQKMGV